LIHFSALARVNAPRGDHFARDSRFLGPFPSVQRRSVVSRVDYSPILGMAEHLTIFQRPAWKHKQRTGKLIVIRNRAYWKASGGSNINHCIQYRWHRTIRCHPLTNRNSSLASTKRFCFQNWNIEASPVRFILPCNSCLTRVQGPGLGA
jgi:hypothetical protein